MTAYVYRPTCTFPTPYGSTTQNGWTSVGIWGAGIRAGTYPIRIAKVEAYSAAAMMYRVDSATFNNSSLATTVTPFALRQGVTTPAPTCTTGVSTVATYLTNNSSYSYTISGSIPSGTFNFLGQGPPPTPNGGSSGSPGVYEFQFDVIIRPGSMFWVGSHVNPYFYSIDGSGTYMASSGSAGSLNRDMNSGLITPNTLSVYFEELPEDWST